MMTTKADQKPSKYRRLGRWLSHIINTDRIVALFTIIIALAAIWTVRDSAKSFRATESPSISLGGPDGILAELRKTGDRSAILLHFYNSGRSEAKHLAINAWTIGEGTFPPTMRLRRRYRLWKGGIESEPGGNGTEVTVCAECLYIVPIPDNALPSSDAIAKMEHSLDPAQQLQINGQVEYCDVFGRFHCETFQAVYKPAPIERFVGTMGLTGCSDEGDKSAPPLSATILDIMAKQGSKLVPLPRCPKSDDPEEEQGSKQMTPTPP